MSVVPLAPVILLTTLPPESPLVTRWQERTRTDAIILLVVRSRALPDPR